MTWAGVWIIARVENPIVIAAATDAPRGERSHAFTRVSLTMIAKQKGKSTTGESISATPVVTPAAARAPVAQRVPAVQRVLATPVVTPAWDPQPA